MRPLQRHASCAIVALCLCGCVAGKRFGSVVGNAVMAVPEFLIDAALTSDSDKPPRLRSPPGEQIIVQSEINY